MTRPHAECPRRVPPRTACPARGPARRAATRVRAQALTTSRGEDGFSTVEVVLLVPVFVMVLLLIVGLGRVEEARVDVTGAVRDAARAASLSRTAEEARDRAAAGLDVALSSRSVSCAGGPDVQVDTTRFAPGGSVTVTVTCPVRLSDLGLPGAPGTKTVTAQAASAIEIHRSQS